jgi:hypothetical protein
MGNQNWLIQEIETCKDYAGFEVPTAVVLKSTVFRYITPCSPLRVIRRFGGTYRLHLQGRKISWARNLRQSRWQVKLYSEDEGDIFLRNVGWISRDYTALYSIRNYYCLSPALTLVFARLIFPSWRWRRYVPPKRRLILNGLHGVISQKLVIFM